MGTDALAPSDASAPEQLQPQPQPQPPGGHGSSPITAVTPEPPVSACDGPASVGHAPLRRLTRTEYERTVGDVFGVVDNVGSGLAVDERIDGPFASNRSSSVVVVQARQYMDAAERIASKVSLTALDRCDRTVNPSDQACARQFITRVGRRAYRRPLGAVEIERYMTLYQAQWLAEGHDAALRLVVQTFLQSPHLLYHMELQEPAGTQSPGLVRVPAYALAARLAYFLWSSAPDDVLLDAAARGELDTDAGLLRQAQRLFDEPRMRGGLDSFHSQWLGLNKLETASRDAALFPEWKPELVTALREESKRFSDYVIRDQQGNFALLLTASYSFPRGPGLKIREGTPDPTTGKLPLDPAWAAGVLTLPAFLAAHAHSNQTSPIIRGRALRERFLCQAMPDPPPDVAAVAPALTVGLTTRERFALHRTSGNACFGCHRLIDDLGFALENFDAIGRYRTQEEGKPIDAAGMLTASDVDGPTNGSRALAERLASSEQAQRCYATQWFRFAIGRNESEADRCALKQVADAFVRGTSIRALLVSITTSAAFVQSRQEE
jgi:hypothetical protein